MTRTDGRAGGGKRLGKQAHSTTSTQLLLNHEELFECPIAQNGVPMKDPVIASDGAITT